jgi:steroid delta-isomerase-like uncharacterized protein
MISDKIQTGEETKNKSVATLYLERGSADWNVMEECIAENCVMYFSGIPEPVRGKQGHKALWDQYHAAFPDIRTKINIILAEGDKVAASFTSEATHLGEMMGIKATGKRAKVSGTSFLRLEKGKIVEDWSSLDQLSLLQQIGAIPAPGQGQQLK